jgi:hypothetical protein
MSIHKLIKPGEVVKLYEKWRQLYQKNNDIGNKVASFVSGDQWQSYTRNTRGGSGKEVLTLNLASKHFNRIMADYMSVDYRLKSQPMTAKEPEHIRNVDELLEHYILKNNSETFATAFEQFIVHGYSVIKAMPDYVNERSHQLVPILQHVAKPEMVFFDCDATLPTKSDGRFCGEVSFIHEDTLKKLYPKYKGQTHNFYNQDEIFSETRKVKVFDFFFKEDETVKFYKIGNKFKPEGTLNEYEKQNLGGVSYFEKLVSKIYTCRCTDEEFLLPPKEFYGIENLPYVFIGQPIFINEEHYYKQVIIPYLYPLLDAQQMLNNAASQISTQATKKIERSVIVDKKSIDQIDINTWEQFNTRAGMFPWKSTSEMGEPNAPPIVLDSPTLDTSLLQLMQLSKVMIDEVMGVNLSQQGSDEDGTQSGVALAQRIAQGDLVQKKYLYVFIKALNQAGQVIKEMLAALITDEYEFMLNGRMVKMNELSPSSLPDEPVRSSSFQKLHEDYNFSIEASPSSQLEKMRSRETYLNIARTLPQYTPYFIDLLFENLDVNNSNELVERFKTMVDPALVAVGKGEISKEQYYQIQQQRQQQQQQQPDAAMALVQMEGQNNQMKAQLKAKELEQTFVLEKDKLVLQQAKLMSENKNEENKEAIKLLEIQTKNLDRRINA